jgi:predicted flap endonuclease-1-like 5' DNA nuclease
MSSLKMIEGIGDVFAQKLKETGVSTLEGFLEACRTKAMRVKLADGAGLSEKLVLKWANHADLVRIKGIGGQYAELLEAAGVDTVPELAQRKADHLTAKMAEVNDKKKLVRKLPVQKQVASWIAQAAALPRILQY